MEKSRPSPSIILPGVAHAYAATRAGVIFDIPHSGRNYPPEFGYSCDLALLQQVEDTQADGFIEDAALSCGAAVVMAQFPRSFVDVNRAADDIDPLSIAGQMSPPPKPGDRALSGHGVFHTYIKGRIPIYDGPILAPQAEARLNDYYTPYYDILEATIAATRHQFGACLLIDCHTMSPSALTPYFSNRLPDIIVGDLDGAACDIHIRKRIQKALTGIGYNVAINTPYKGAAILSRCADQAGGINAVQLEISKSLYMDDLNTINDKKFNKLKENMKLFIQQICGDVLR